MQSHLTVNNIVKALLEMEVEVSYDDSTNTKPILLRDYITPNVLNQIGIKLALKLGKSNQDKVTEFNDTFKVERARDVVPNVDALTAVQELRLRLIVEETVELAFALGFSPLVFKKIIKELVDKVYANPPHSGDRSYVETFDALIDLLYVTYGALDCFNLASKTEAGFEEVHSSNMSKVCDNREVLIRTVKKYREEGITLATEELPNGKFIVKHADTQKVLKSVNYRPANLHKIIYKS